MYKTSEELRCFADCLYFDMDVIVYDCETTGLHPIPTTTSPRSFVIQLSARRYKYQAFIGFEQVEERNWYIKPFDPVPTEIVQLTGITNEFLEDMPKENEVFDEIHEFFGNSIVCGYNNIAFDDIFLDEMYKRYNAGGFHPQVSLDMCQVARMMVGPSEVPNYKLQTIASYCGAAEEAFHNAMYDVDATAQVMEYFATQLQMRYFQTDSMMPNYEAGIKLKVTRIARYEKGKIARIYVNTEDPEVTFFMDTRTLQWYCKEKDIDTDRFNMPYIVSQVLKLALISTEKELAQYGKAK